MEDTSSEAIRVLRAIDQEFGGRRFRLVTVLDPTPPPLANISTAHCLAFKGDGVVLTRHVERGWTIPGGHLEADESPEEAMHREAREEAGIAVRDLVVIAHERIEPLDNARDPRYPVPSFQVFYVAELVSLGEITATMECTEARVFSPDAARSAEGWVQRNSLLYEAALDVARRRYR